VCQLAGNGNKHVFCRKLKPFWIGQHVFNPIESGIFPESCKDAAKTVIVGNEILVVQHHDGRERTFGVSEIEYGLGVNANDVNGAVRKTSEGLTDVKCSFCDVKRLYFVCNVNQMDRIVALLENRSF